MEVCAGFELIVIENATALSDDVLEISKRRDVLVGEWLVENGAEVFGGLQFGRARGQVGEPDPVRDSQVRCGIKHHARKLRADRAEGRTKGGSGLRSRTECDEV